GLLAVTCARRGVSGTARSRGFGGALGFRLRLGLARVGGLLACARCFAVSLRRWCRLAVVGDVKPGPLEDQRRRRKQPPHRTPATFAAIEGLADSMHRLKLVVAA